MPVIVAPERRGQRGSEVQVILGYTASQGHPGLRETPSFQKNIDTWNKTFQVTSVQKKNELQRKWSRLTLQCFTATPSFHSDPRPELRFLIKMLFTGLFSLGGEHWFLMLDLSQCWQSKSLLLGQQNIRSVVLKEGPMRPHTHPHKPPGRRSPLQTQQLAGKLLRIMARGPACTPTQSVWGFLFFF